MECIRWLHRLRVTIVGIAVIAIAVGLVLTLIGVDSVPARVLYTLATLVYCVYVLYEVYNDARAMFNGNARDDKLVTFYTLLDATMGYILAGSLLLMLFWVWGEDFYFTLVETWTTASPSETWARFFITAVFSSDSGLTIYVPIRVASEMTLALYTIGGRILSSFILGMGIAVVLENNNNNQNTPPATSYASCLTVDLKLA